MNRIEPVCPNSQMFRHFAVFQGVQEHCRSSTAVFLPCQRTLHVTPSPITAAPFHDRHVPLECRPSLGDSGISDVQY
jgi:hypothetical protein